MMRTTLRIDDDLLRQLKQRAQREGTPLTQLVNQVIRRGLEQTAEGRSKSRRSYREQPFSLGVPRIPLDKALALAASMEEAEVLEKMARRK
jgi:hypothetical protein